MKIGELKNLGGKSAAWLRQVGIHNADDLKALGAIQAFWKVKRAGFKPSLNLLYALEGALCDCHWNQVSKERRADLVLAISALEDAETGARKVAPVREISAGAYTEERDGVEEDSDAGYGGFDADEEPSAESDQH